METLCCFYPNFDQVIATKFCIRCDDIAIMACASICSDRMAVVENQYEFSLKV